MKKIRLLLFCFICLVPFFVLANVIRVPGNYPTIQQAINASQSGDTVLVDDGVYIENIVFPDYPIVVASQYLMDNDPTHIDNTIIDGSSPTDPDRASVVDMTLVTDTLSVICGFTIQGGAGTLNLGNGVDDVRIGGGINILAGKVIHNIIRENIIEGPYLIIGAGISYGSPIGSGNLVIRNNQIYGNKLIGSEMAQGAGISLIPYDGFVMVENNHIFDNLATISGPYKAIGGGICIVKYTSFGSRVVIRNNRIYQNKLYCNVTAGAGVYIVPWYDTPTPDTYQPIEIYNNLIYDNYSQEMGGGIAVWYVGAYIRLAPVDPVIYNNTIVNNEARIGAGISNMDAEIVLFNNIIWNKKKNTNDREIRNQLTNYCPHWCRGSFTGIVHSSNNSLSDLDADELCNNCFPNLDDNFCLCSGNYNVGHGIQDMIVKGVTYNAPGIDFNNDQRPAPIDEFVDIGAIESPFEIGFSCTTSAEDPIIPSDWSDVTVYPNPFEDYLLIGNLPFSNEGMKIRVTDILGRTILNEKPEIVSSGVFKIPTPDLRMGVYMCSIYHHDQFIKSFLLVNRNR